MPTDDKTRSSHEDEKQLQISAEPGSLAGAYANFAIISHTPGEFVLDFCMRTKDHTVLTSRVITNPGHAKRLAAALATNIETYEKKFGAIQSEEQMSAVKPKRMKTRKTKKRGTARKKKSARRRA